MRAYSSLALAFIVVMAGCSSGGDAGTSTPTIAPRALVGVWESADKRSVRVLIDGGAVWYGGRTEDGTMSAGCKSCDTWTIEGNTLLAHHCGPTGDHSATISLEGGVLTFVSALEVLNTHAGATFQKTAADPVSYKVCP